MPKVSVIVPNYNHATYLNERINSILSQTFKDYELILMDDNSSDNSKEILDSYRSIPNVKIVFNEVNSGSSFKQWNKGMKLSTGEYIWIAESDDFAAKELLSTLVPVLENNPDVSLVYSQSHEINAKGLITGTGFSHIMELDTHKWASDFIIQGNEMIKEYMLHHNYVPNASGVLFRRSKAEYVGMADEKFRLNGDWLFWIKLMENSNTAFIAKSLNYFRKHGSSVRSSTQASGLGLYEYSQIIDYVSNHLKFTSLEKKDIVAEFYRKTKWAPAFYSWKLEPVAFKYLRKSYINLSKLNNIAFFLFINHIIIRFFLYHIRAFMYKNFKKPFMDFMNKKIFPNNPAFKKVVLTLRDKVFGNPYGKDNVGGNV